MMFETIVVCLFVACAITGGVCTAAWYDINRVSPLKQEVVTAEQRENRLRGSLFEAERQRDLARAERDEANEKIRRLTETRDHDCEMYERRIVEGIAVLDPHKVWRHKEPGYMGLES